MANINTIKCIICKTNKTASQSGVCRICKNIAKKGN